MMKRVRALFKRDVRPGKKRNAIAARATVSRLEKRLLLAVTWINPEGGDWDTTANWSTGQLPGPGDEVIINTPGITITHSSNTVDTVSSLMNDANVTLAGGSLVVTGQVQGSGTLTLAGGTLGSATVDAGTTVNATNSGGTLSGVTLGGTLDLNSSTPTVTVQSGLTLSGGSIEFGATSYGVVRFTDAAASLGGTGSVTFNNGASSIDNTLQEDLAGGTLTIGPGVTVSGGTGTIGDNIYLGGPSNVSFVNEGTIDADAAGTITLDGNAWSTSGTIETSGGGTVDLEGTGWSNTGTATADGGTLNLGGTFTSANLGSVTGAQGTVNLTGTLTNTGGTLALNATTGSMNLSGGTIDGGTVRRRRGARLEATNQAGSTLEGGVTLSGDPSLSDPIVLDLASSTPTVTISGGALTLANATVAIEPSDFGTLSFTDTSASLAGTGDVTFNNVKNTNSSYRTIAEATAGGTLTIGPGVTISGGAGTIGYNLDLGGPSNVSFVNAGTIAAGAAGTITLDGSPWSNTGTITASGGATVDFAGTGWTNSGTVTGTGGTLNLGGTFAAATLGSVTGAGGTVNLTGTVNNTGGTLALNATTGSWNLAGGTIDGGTVSATAGARLEVTAQGSKLEGGVTLLGDPSLSDPIVLDLAASTEFISVSIGGGALTLSNATVAIEPTSYGSASLSFTDAAASLAGTGDVTFNNGTDSAYDSLQEDAAGGTLTIGPGVTISGGTGTIGYNAYVGGQSTVSFVNEGTIESGGAGTITLSGNAWSNSGTITSSSGGTIDLAGTGWSNSGTVTAAGGTLNLGGTFASATLGSVMNAGGTVNLTGTLNNTGGALALNATTGSWDLMAGTIDGGTVSAAGGARLEATNYGGTLKGGVTLSGDPSLSDPIVLDLNSEEPTVTITGGALTLANATVAMEATGDGRLSFTDAQASLAGTGSVTFNNISEVVESIEEDTAPGTLTIGPGVTVSGGTGTIGQSRGFPANVTFVNEGTIDADAAGTITLNGTPWSNSGTLEASGGGALDLGGTFTTAGLGSVTNTGGTVNLTGTLTNTGSTLALDATTGSLDLMGGTIDGGTVTAAGGALLEATDYGGTLEGGVTLSGDPSLSDPIVLDLATDTPVVTVSGGALTLANATVAFEASTSGTLSFTDVAASLAGTGSVTFNNGATSDDNTLAEDASGGTLTIGPGVTVSGGTGSIGYNSNSLYGYTNVSFVNKGTIDADSAGTLSLGGTWSNTGTITASAGGTLDLGGTFATASLGSVTNAGGTVNLTGTLTNTGSTLALNATTGSWDLSGGTIQGGTVSAVGGARLEGTDQGGALKGGVTLSGDPSLSDPVVLDLASAQPNVTISGGALTLANATVAIEGSLDGSLRFNDAAASLAGSGNVTFNNPGNPSYSFDNAIFGNFSGGTLTIGPGVTISGGLATIGSDEASLVNEGTIDADGAGTITLGATAWSSTGTIEASGGGTLTATSAPTNFGAGTLTGGTWQVTSPGTLRVPFGSSVVTNAANIVVDGASAFFYRNSQTTLALGGLTTNAATGSFTIEGGASFSSTAAFSNAGSVLIGTGSTFAPDGSFTQTGGSTVLAGGVLGTSSPATTVNVEAGSLAGTGTIKGNLTNSGQLSPGSPIGTLTVTGSFNQTASGSLDVDLTGTAAGQFSQLAAGGTATLGGALDVTVASGFVAPTGSAFAIVTAASVNGQFATTSGLNLGGGNSLEAIYDPADVTLLSQAAAGVQVSPTSGLVSSQAGETATFSVVLTTQPADSVSFGVSSSNTNAGTVSTSQLIFTTANWNIPQNVTVTGVDDQMDDGDVPYTIVIAPAVSSDPAYNGFQAPAVSVTNHGTVIAGITVAPVSGLVTTSVGGSATFTVVLNSKPAAEVDIGLSSSNTSEGVVSTGSLAFTASDWNVPQTVTVTGVVGGGEAGSVAYSVVFAAATSTDPKYNGLVAAPVSVTNVNPAPDLQVANLKVLPSTGVESGDALLVEWNDANTGTAPVDGSFTDSITVTNLTTGMTLGTGIVSYDEATSGPIAPGASPSEQFMFTLPNGTAGTGQIQFTVTTNSGNTIVEGNASGTASTNNTAMVTITSTLASYPDLTVTDLATSATSGMLAGGSYVLSWDDANTGNAATPVGTSWADTVIITNTSTGQMLADVDVPYNAALDSSGPIPAGGSEAQQYAFTLPGGPTGTGQIQFTVEVNSNAAVFEYNSAGTATTNNTATITETSALGTYPDLQVTNLSVAPSPGLQSGGSVTVSWDQTNTGNAAAYGTWVDSLLIQNTTTDQTLTIVKIPYDASATGNGPLAAGKSEAEQYTYQLPDGAPGVGQFQFTVILNSTESLFEYNVAGTAYTNDTATIGATSTIAAYPDLQVENLSLTPSSGLDSGASVVLHWQDANTGNGTTTGAWDDRVVVENTTTGQTLATTTLDYDAAVLGALSPGAAASQQYAFTLPAGMSGFGTIQFAVTTNALNQMFEYNSSGTAQSNNTSSISAVSGLSPAADLQVANLSLAPSTGLQSGSNVVLSWDDLNAGDAATDGSWTDSVTVTNQTTGATIFTGTIPYDGSASGNGSLGEGDSFAQKDAFQIPQGNAGVGPLQFTVVVDSAQSIADYASTGGVDPKGTAVLDETSTLAPYPDLAVSNVSAPSLTVGDPATVTIGWTVTNTGTAATPESAWDDSIIASPTDAPNDPSAIVLGTFSHTGALAVGQSYNQSETFLLPPAFSGQYYLFVHSDAGNVVFQNGPQANNYAQAPNLFDVTQTPYADLIVSSVDAPATAASGLPLTLSWSVTNQGIGVTSIAGWSDTISLATDPQGKDIVATLGSFGHLGVLSPGEGYSRSGQVSLPNGISGTYYIVVQSSGPYEFIYTNNNTSVSGPVTVSLTPAPDLAVTSIQTPATVVSDGTFDVTWTVQNLGPGDADGLWPDVVSLEEVGGQGRTIPLGSFTYINTLAAGKSYTRTEQFTLPADIQGVFQAVVTTDPLEIFGGRDQYEVSNPVDTTSDPNPLVITLQQNPDLQVESITPAASTFQAGGTLGVQFVVINQGSVATNVPRWTDNVYLSLDDTLSEDDILLGSVGNQSALHPGQSYLSSLSDVVIPKSLAGSYFLIVEANADGAEDDFPNDNNNTLAVPITINPILPSDLVVSNVIVPAQAIAGSQIQVTYTVTNLGNGPTDLSSWTDGVWLATDRKEPYVTGTLLATVTETGVLTNDPHDPDLPQSYTQTLTVTLPPHLSGQLFITPQTDLYQQLDETTLTANVNPDDPDELRSDNFKAAPIIVLPEPPPDLVVSAIKVPASVPAGTVFPVTWTVTNQGDGTTEDSQWYDGIYLSNEPTWTPGADPQQLNLGFFLHTGILTPDESYTAEQSILLSPSYSGDYIIVYTNELSPSGSAPAPGRARMGTTTRPRSRPTFSRRRPICR